MTSEADTVVEDKGGEGWKSEIAWQRNHQIQDMLSRIRQQGHMSVSGLRKYMRQALGKFLNIKKKVEKADGLKIEEMFDKRMTKCGREALQENIHNLKAEKIRDLHAETCEACQAKQACYIDRMVNVIRWGWRPDVGEMTDMHVIGKNGKNARERFNRKFEEEVTKAVNKGYLRQNPDGEMTPGQWHPLNMAVKPSDKMAAKIHTGVEINDQETLDAANTGLARSGIKEVKCRITTNCTAGGMNAAAYVPPFTHPTVEDAVAFIQPGDWLAKGDVESYYSSFPIAKESQRLFQVATETRGIMTYVVLCFGFAAGAYYAAMWAAEARKWVLGRGVKDVVHMTDDWLVAGRSEEEARSRMRIISTVLETAGFKMAPSKFEHGQVLTFLGIRIDTISMTLSFDKVQCQVAVEQLSQAMEKLEKGCLSKTEAQQIAGKLTWFGGVLQAGRLHTAAWWKMTRTEGDRINQRDIRKVKKDTEWWLGILRDWAKEEISRHSFPLLSARSLETKQDMIYVVQSDYAGEGNHPGYGIIHGHLGEPNPRCVSISGTAGEEALGHSTWGELRALEIFLKENATRIGGFKNGLLIWVSDSASGVFAVDGGGCADQESRQVLEGILDTCDESRITIVGMWVPREQNTLADHLSHLSSSLNVDRIDTDFKRLTDGHTNDGSEGKASASETDHLPGIPGLLSDAGLRSITSDVTDSGRLR